MIYYIIARKLNFRNFFFFYLLIPRQNSKELNAIIYNHYTDLSSIVKSHLLALVGTLGDRIECWTRSCPDQVAPQIPIYVLGSDLSVPLAGSNPSGFGILVINYFIYYYFQFNKMVVKMVIKF